MNNKNHGYEDQSSVWNGDAGNAWVETQQLVEQMFKPIETMLVDGIKLRAGQGALDVGCGTGSTTLALSRQSASDGTCVGIDISQQMIAAARSSAEQQGLTPAFLCEDVQRYAFQPQSFDWIISRFGVMFFDDAIAAFNNLRQAARPAAQLRFIAWRSAEENPFMTTAEFAAKDLLPDLPQRQPDQPGQFAFARQQHIADILQLSNWADIRIEAVDVACSFPESALLLYLARMGPVGRALQKQQGDTGARIIAAVREAFEPYVCSDTVRFTAACWQVNARACK